jgi:uncharacterized membrane protein
MKHRGKHKTKEQILESKAPIQNPNATHCEQMTPLELFAMKVTDRVGSPGFFLIIFLWTVLWVGYNILASLVPALHWKAFDPFPAFVAYLLISNVIQILLMPLIMVGQNLQSRHSELRAESDFEVNVRAEVEIKEILLKLEQQQNLIEQLVNRIDQKIE